ncbi:hypothetical protein N7456_004735 [Penicillium angulare]|uniref:Nucleoside phosphorylase domain-containing protein n=1 Tax=Penicillium angulare TaxID=116970 RepID=A0A9W9KIW0_9EURO|nr:hypothetical protein N7456_004735 [Penicillium angulare]
MSDPQNYQVGWICAIETEYVAAKAFLDEIHEGPEYLSPSDNNDYTLGRVGNHNIVIAILPEGEYGTTSAASVARDMLHSFTNIRVGLMVGIAGGAPSASHDIRLGDVVVSAARDGKGGVVQFDFGKRVQCQEFQRVGFLNQPPTVLRTAVVGLRSQHTVHGHQLDGSVNSILKKNPRLQPKFARPDNSTDLLYRSDFLHVQGAENCGNTCGSDPSILRVRSERSKDDNTLIHYGLIASSNQLLKDAPARDQLAEEGILCFEMEAAGLMNHFPCLVIRGICDYSDTHKNKDWQGHAALVAAAYARDLLYRIPPSRVEAEKRLDDKFTGLQRSLDSFVANQETRAILDWISMATPSLQQRDLIRRRQSGTGEWLLESKEIMNWIDTSGQTLFFPGNPGVGKTIATSIIIDHLQTTHGNKRIGVGYLFLNFQEKQKQQTMDLFLSLLRQLIRLPIPEAVKALHTEHSGRNTYPSFSEILNLLQEVIAGYSQVFFLVDALDECVDSLRFISELLKLQKKTGVNIYATSRFIPDITRLFREFPAIEIKFPNEDIQRYLDEAMPLQLRPFILEDASLRAEILNKAIEVSDGVFLLAKLYLDFLGNATTHKAVRTALFRFSDTPNSSSPGEVTNAFDRVYGRIMRRIQDQPKGLHQLANKVLSWITCAMRPLSPLALQHALAVDSNSREVEEENVPNLEDMITVCAGLVTIDEASNIIRLTHHTAREYFERTRDIWFPDAQGMITGTCINYISSEKLSARSFKLMDQVYDPSSLYYYAALNWGNHARMSSLDGSEQVMKLLARTENMKVCSAAMIYIVREEQNQIRWTSISNLGGSSQYFLGDELSAVQLAAYFGLRRSMSALLSNNNTRHLSSRTWIKPIIRISTTIKVSIAKILLSYYPEPDHEFPCPYDRPLTLAAKNGHDGVVEFLLSLGVKPKFFYETRDETALEAASSRGFAKVVKLLIEYGDNVNRLGWDGVAPLMQASFFGHDEVVELLLEKHAQSNIVDENGHSALSYAAVMGHYQVVKLLLKHGATVDLAFKAANRSSKHTAPVRYGKSTRLLSKSNMVPSANGAGRAPLSWTAEGGHIGVVELLLTNGAHIDLIDYNGGTALLWAISGGHEAVVKLLLAKGADINSTDKSGRAPLSWAASRGHESIVRLLLEKGSDIDARDMEGLTPLWWAAKEGQENITWMLIDLGANTEINSGLGSRYICEMENSENDLLIKVLLSHRTARETPDCFGRTAMLRAAETRRYSRLEFIIEKGANLEARDPENKTALWWAVMNQHGSMTKLLIHNNANLNVQDDLGRTPLHLSAEAHNVEIFRALVEGGAILDIEDSQGRTPLMWAIIYGNENLVKILLENDICLESEDVQWGRTALLWAARKSYPNMVRLLLENGASIEAADHSGQTALSIAARYGHEEAVKILLGHGADTESEDYQDFTPHKWATLGGYGSIANTLKPASQSTKDF